MNDTEILETRSETETEMVGPIKRVKPYRPGAHAPEHIAPLVNTPGDFLWISKHQLHCDPRYQRPVKEKKVWRIANYWNWPGCGALAVARRPDGSYFIYDGQHRYRAAMCLPQVQELPCLVYEMAELRDEAAGFISINLERSTLPITERFQALLMVGNRQATRLEQMAREAGRHIGVPSDKTHISCIATIMRCLKDDEKPMLQVWPVIIHMHRDHPMLGRLVLALWATERRMPFGHSLNDNRWRDRLHKLGPLFLQQQLAAALALEGKWSETIYANAIVRELNKGVRGNRLSLRKRLIDMGPKD